MSRPDTAGVAPEPHVDSFESYKNRNEVESIINRYTHNLYAEMMFKCIIPSFGSSLALTEEQRNALATAQQLEEVLNREVFMPDCFRKGYVKMSAKFHRIALDEYYYARGTFPAPWTCMQLG